MVKNFPRILYFIKGPTPNREEYEAILKCGPNVAFRNALHVPADATVGSLEACDGVAGAVPEVYAKNRPSVEDAIAKFEKDQRDKWDKHDAEYAEKERKAAEKAEAKAKAAVKVEAEKQQSKATPTKAGAAWNANQ